MLLSNIFEAGLNQRKHFPGIYFAILCFVHSTLYLSWLLYTRTPATSLTSPAWSGISRRNWTYAPSPCRRRKTNMA